MIPKIVTPVETSWQKELAQAYRDPARLLADLEVDPLAFSAGFAARKLFPVMAPVPYVTRMKKGDAQDPLLRQVLPLQQEFEQVAGFGPDPLQEQQSAVPGLLHKYQSRVLMIVRGGCAINCRYCFRRHFPYSDNTPSKAGWQQALTHIREDQRINEVILSGGDPLMAKDDFLAWLTAQIASIPHIKRLRLHTRLPLVIPSRINAELMEWLTGTRLKPVMVWHINHANEIDAAVEMAARQLRLAGVTLLNQAVLLRGVNDSIEAQVALSERLFETDILPYYLHLLDRVQGAAHFDLPESRAREIMAGAIKRLPGYLVPKLVREIGNQPGKTPIDLHLQP
ncbi:EF-P beta-lysylation protein EpmB [Bowmanella dokdonensis]